MKKHPGTVKNDDLQAHLKYLVDAVASMPISAKIEALNHIRQALHEVSPFADPIDCVLWVQADQVRGNDYNPNKVAPPEMRLLNGGDHPPQSSPRCSRRCADDGRRRHPDSGGVVRHRYLRGAGYECRRSVALQAE